MPEERLDRHLTRRRPGRPSGSGRFVRRLERPLEKRTRRALVPPKGG